MLWHLKSPNSSSAHQHNQPARLKELPQQLPCFLPEAAAAAAASRSTSNPAPEASLIARGHGLEVGQHCLHVPHQPRQPLRQQLTAARPQHLIKLRLTDSPHVCQVAGSSSSGRQHALDAVLFTGGCGGQPAVVALQCEE